MGIIRNRHWSAALAIGFTIYIFAYVVLQQLIFNFNSIYLHGIYYQNYIPGSSLLCELFGWYLGTHLPLDVWMLSAGIMVPFGCFLFLLLEDCYSFYSIGLITFILSGIMNLVDYYFLAPVFDIDFIFSSLVGAFLGYLLTVIALKFLVGRQLRLIMEEAPKYRKRI